MKLKMKLEEFGFQHGVKHVDSVKNLSVGSEILLKNVYIKKGFGEQLEIYHKKHDYNNYSPNKKLVAVSKNCS